MIICSSVFHNHCQHVNESRAQTSSNSLPSAAIIWQLRELSGEGRELTHMGKRMSCVWKWKWVWPTGWNRREGKNDLLTLKVWTLLNTLKTMASNVASDESSTSSNSWQDWNGNSEFEKKVFLVWCLNTLRAVHWSNQIVWSITGRNQCSEYTVEEST